MSEQSVAGSFPVFFDASGIALENGFVYVGTAGADAKTNLATVYWDQALTIPASQPIRTNGGYLMNSGSPGRIYVDATTYSITVEDRNGVPVYSELTSSTTPNVSAGYIDSESAAAGTVLTADGAGGSSFSAASAGSTNLSYTASTRTVASDTGTNAVITEVVAAGNSGLMTGSDKSKLNGIESGATADQSDAEIETAYNNQVSVVSQAEAEAGTATTVRRWTAQRVGQAIAALGGAVTEAVASNSSSGTHSAGIVTESTTVTISNADDTSTGAEVTVFATKQHGGYTSKIDVHFKRALGSSTWEYIAYEGGVVEIDQGSGKTVTFASDTSTIVLSSTASNITITYNWTTGAIANTARVAALVKTSA